MNASMRPVPRRGVSGGIVQRRQSASMPQQAMRPALSAVAEAQEGQGAGAARGRSFTQRRAARGGDGEAGVGGEKEKDGVGLGVPWHPVPNEG